MTTPPEALDASAGAVPHVTPMKAGGINAEGLLAKHLHLESRTTVKQKVERLLVDEEKERLGNTVWDELVNSSQKALREADPKKWRKQPEATSYPLAVRLLNSISLALFHITGRNPATDFAIVYQAYPNKIVPGSYLGEEFKPDVTAERLTYADLLEALESDTQDASAVPWSMMATVAEHKKNGTAGGLAQLTVYLASLKRYRVDLETVYGYTISGSKIRVAGLNACEMFVSPLAPAHKADSWATYVSLVYRSEDQRDQRLSCVTSQSAFYRWDTRVHDGDHFAVAPFHVSRPPGRITFSCFRLLPLHDSDESKMENFFLNKPTDGFWKLSWQDVNSNPSEGELLDLVHCDGWIPGVVRHEWHERNNPSTAISGKLGIARVQESIMLRSIGEPLSQCATPRELLYVMYDALEAHVHMSERDVLHRDLSWFNVLCHPTHFPVKHKEMRQEVPRKCIKRIMQDLQKREDNSYESSVLLIDLDHGAKITELHEDKHTDRIERTGTPMFIAVELVNRQAQAKPDPFQSANLRELKRSLNRIEQFPGAYEAAFPHGDERFMARIAKVLPKYETWLEDESAPVPRKSAPHELRHDAESMYWVMLWAFARANPVGDEEEPAINDDFCRAMLRHRIGAAKDTREVFRMANSLKQLFHSRLDSFHRLFQEFANYLAIPWYRFERPSEGDGTMHQSHMHVAFRRILLAFLLDPKNQTILDIPLDTAKPRETDGLEERARTASVSLLVRGSTGVPTSKQSQSKLQKRKASDNVTDSMEAAPARKKQKSSARAMDAEDDPANNPADDYDDDPMGDSGDGVEGDSGKVVEGDPANNPADDSDDDPMDDSGDGAKGDSGEDIDGDSGEDAKGDSEDTEDDFGENAVEDSEENVEGESESSQSDSDYDPGVDSKKNKYPPWMLEVPASDAPSSASKLIRMIWNDRSLWFGKGV